MTPSAYPYPDKPIGQCHHCGTALHRDSFVHNNQTGHAYCNVGCQRTFELANGEGTQTQAQSDALEAAAVAQFLAFGKLRDIVTEARQRADASARLDAALAVL